MTLNYRFAQPDGIPGSTRTTCTPQTSFPSPMPSAPIRLPAGLMASSRPDTDPLVLHPVLGRVLGASWLSGAHGRAGA